MGGLIGPERGYLYISGTLFIFLVPYSVAGQNTPLGQGAFVQVCSASRLAIDRCVAGDMGAQGSGQGAQRSLPSNRSLSNSQGAASTTQLRIYF
jgi:hypothetical protein